MIGVFVDRSPPPHLEHKARTTTVDTKMRHGPDLKDRTTRESAGNTNPSKHDASFGIRYRHIQIHAPPPPPAKTPVTAYSTFRQRKSADRCIIPSAQPCQPIVSSWSGS